jgi:hypothetical protein
MRTLSMTAGIDSTTDQDQISDVEYRLKQTEQKLAKLEERTGRASLWLIGCILATVLSWSRNASILWAVVHCIFSWFYVLYYAQVTGRIWGS